MAAPVLVIDFGSQLTQLIARRVREAGVYCEIVPFDKAEAALSSADPPRAIILSGGPASLTESHTPRAPQKVFEFGVPVLGICYGQMAMVQQLGGQVENSGKREYGRAQVEIVGQSPLFDNIWSLGSEDQVWMSHGDRVIALPPGFRVVGKSANTPFAIVADDARKFYGLMFHPEVMHTPRGAALLANFVTGIAGIPADWNMKAFRAEEVKRIRKQVGRGRVICGLSGGVDSSVAAVLIHEAIGDQLTCIFVDTGLMRAGEADEVVTLFRGHYNIPLVHVDAADIFLSALEGVSDPEAQAQDYRRGCSSRCSRRKRPRSGGAEFLAQGTLYPDVIESVSLTGGPSVTIKSITMSAACPSGCA